MHADQIKAQLEQALARVEYQPGDHPVVPVKHDAFVKEIRAITAALSAQAEPVAWSRHDEIAGGRKITSIQRVAEIWRDQGCAVTPLYTTPPAPAPVVRGEQNG